MLWSEICQTHIEDTLERGIVNGSPKSTKHSRHFKGKSETNQDVSSHNVVLRHFLGEYKLMGEDSEVFILLSTSYVHVCHLTLC